ncbi:polynucleotide kinase [Ruegeria phage RpAliso]|nr:polynucleotide kinase [Ruegeria phage RpAliso]
MTKFNTSHERLNPFGYLQPRVGLLPKALDHHDVVVLDDVHLGRTHIWKGMEGVLVCDIDGTIADLTHRRKYVASKPKNYPAFEKTMHLDTPIPHVIEAVRTLYYAGWTVIMCSGRSMKNRAVTIAWLEEHSVPFHDIYMRAEFREGLTTRKGDPMPDHRLDSIVKKELLDRIRAHHGEPDIAFDDRDQVVAMWRENGIPVVQVAEGDF